MPSSTPGIPSELRRKLDPVLQDSPEFTSDSKLRAVFSNVKLKPFLGNLPESDAMISRVNSTLNYLHSKYLVTGENALTIFLLALAESRDEEDQQRVSLIQRAEEWEIHRTSKQGPSSRGMPEANTQNNRMEEVRSVDTLQNLQRELVNTLLELEVTARFSGRSSLLETIPKNLTNDRHEENRQLDLQKIVGLAVNGQLNDGRYPLLIIIDNALAVAEGGETGRKLKDIKLRLEIHYGVTTAAPVPSQATEGEERFVFGCDKRLPEAWYEERERVKAGIAYLQVPIYRDRSQYRSAGEGSTGTGWLIAPNLLLTNHHVINARQKTAPGVTPQASDVDLRLQVENMVVRLEKAGTAGREVAVEGLVAHANSDSLDYALLRLQAGGGLPLEDPQGAPVRRHLQVYRNLPELEQETLLNILQYSGKGELLSATRNNHYAGPGERSFEILYMTDTDAGASGSPVCTDAWQVVALHKGWTTAADREQIIDGKKARYRNKGILIDHILADLPPEIRQEIADAQGWK